MYVFNVQLTLITFFFFCVVIFVLYTLVKYDASVSDGQQHSMFCEGQKSPSAFVVSDGVGSLRFALYCY